MVAGLTPKRLMESSYELGREAQEFVDIISTGENINPLPHLIRASINFLFLTIFSFRTTSMDDPVFKDGHHLVETIMSFTGFKYSIPNLLPIMKYTPTFSAAEKEFTDVLLNQALPFFSKLIDEALKVDGENMTKLFKDTVDDKGIGGNHRQFLMIIGKY